MAYPREIALVSIMQSTNRFSAIQQPLVLIRPEVTIQGFLQGERADFGKAIFIYSGLFFRFDLRPPISLVQLLPQFGFEARAFFKECLEVFALGFDCARQLRLRL